MGPRKHGVVGSKQPERRNASIELLDLNDEIYGEHSTCSRSWNSYPSCPSFFLLLLVRLEQLIL